jgi:hypothetical protein
MRKSIMNRKVDVTGVGYGERPKIICTVSVRNEGWILDRFLKCASLWADHVIVLNHKSTDNSSEIALRYPKVKLIECASSGYDEAEKRGLLIESARMIPGKRLIIALDADEMLTANLLASGEWESILNSPEGTVIEARWVNVLPDLSSCWIPTDFTIPFAFMDDGGSYVGTKIHSLRIPYPKGAHSILPEGIKILHYPYTDWERMESKMRWYQCWERISNPKRRPVSIYRQYHDMYAIPPGNIHPLKDEWFRGYEERGVDMRSVNRLGSYWWDMEVLKFFDEHGLERFRKLDVWGVDWAKKGREIGFKPRVKLRDPRSCFDRFVHGWLRRTQIRKSDVGIRFIQKILILLGWNR